MKNDINGNTKKNTPKELLTSPDATQLSNKPMANPIVPDFK